MGQAKSIQAIHREFDNRYELIFYYGSNNIVDVKKHQENIFNMIYPRGSTTIVIYKEKPGSDTFCLKKCDIIAGRPNYKYKYFDLRGSEIEEESEEAVRRTAEYIGLVMPTTPSFPVRGIFECKYSNATKYGHSTTFNFCIGNMKFDGLGGSLSISLTCDDKGSSVAIKELTIENSVRNNEGINIEKEKVGLNQLEKRVIYLNERVITLRVEHLNR